MGDPGWTHRAVVAVTGRSADHLPWIKCQTDIFPQLVLGARETKGSTSVHSRGHTIRGRQEDTRILRVSDHRGRRERPIGLKAQPQLYHRQWGYVIACWSFPLRLNTLMDGSRK